MKLRTAGFAALVGLVGFTTTATTAAAIGTTYGATFQGTANGVDTLGLFGSKGAALTNASFSEMFLIDTLVGNKRNSTAQQDEWSTSSSFITATLTINGKTVSVRSSTYGEAFVNNGGDVANPSTGIYYKSGYGGTDAYHAVYDYVAGSTSTGASYVGVLASWADNSLSAFKGFPTALGQSFSTSFAGTSTTGGGAFTLYTDCFDQLETITLRPTVAAAPEPGAWALMIVGVAGIGSALRRRRRAAVPAPVELV